VRALFLILGLSKREVFAHTHARRRLTAGLFIANTWRATVKRVCERTMEGYGGKALATIESMQLGEPVAFLECGKCSIVEIIRESDTIPNEPICKRCRTKRLPSEPGSPPLPSTLPPGLERWVELLSSPEKSTYAQVLKGTASSS
jgi:hypothetical protein